MTHRKRRFSIAWLLPLALLGCTGRANAQTLFILPPHAPKGPGLVTFSLVVDTGIFPAVGWGTDITLADTNILKFTPDFGGTGQPFRSSQPFFDLDLSSPYTAGSGTLNLYFLNSTPGAILSQSGMVELGQFQVQVLQDPGISGTAITLDDLGTPPFGSAVQDEDGNNLLLSVSGALVTRTFPSPEPGGWLAMASGTALFALGLRRRTARRS